jgi:hypothetical protein
MDAIDLTAGGGAQTVTVPAATAGFQVKGATGRLMRVLVLANMATTALTFYDSIGAASGVVIGVVPTTATAGTVWVFQMPAYVGIYAVGGTGQTACTVSFN